MEKKLTKENATYTTLATLQNLVARGPVHYQNLFFTLKDKDYVLKAPRQGSDHKDVVVDIPNLGPVVFGNQWCPTSPGVAEAFGVPPEEAKEFKTGIKGLNEEGQLYHMEVMGEYYAKLMNHGAVAICLSELPQEQRLQEAFIHAFNQTIKGDNNKITLNDLNFQQTGDHKFGFGTIVHPSSGFRITRQVEQAATDQKPLSTQCNRYEIVSFHKDSQADINLINVHGYFMTQAATARLFIEQRAGSHQKNGLTIHGIGGDTNISNTRSEFIKFSGVGEEEAKTVWSNLCVALGYAKDNIPHSLPVTRGLNTIDLAAVGQSPAVISTDKTTTQKRPNEQDAANLQLSIFAMKQSDDAASQGQKPETKM